MPQIHLHAEPGDYAPVVLLPGRPEPRDPDRGALRRRPRGAAGSSRRIAACSATPARSTGVPVSVQTTMMGTPTTSIVVEELLMLGVTTFIRVGTTGGFGRTAIGDVGRGDGGRGAARASATCSAAARPRPRRRPRRRARAGRRARAPRASRRTSGPIVTGDVFYDPSPGGAGRWGRRGYLSAEMETAALYLLAMREQGKGRPVRAGCILTVSDVIADPARAARPARAATRPGSGRPRTR